MFKKAAMFGLDARIALAIFGALSVISGASLYSTIQEVKSTALLSDLKEIGKAWEQFYLDTGETLPRTSNDQNTAGYRLYKSAALSFDDYGVDNWKGPYLSFVRIGDYIKHPQYYSVSLFELSDEDGWDNWTSGFCVANKVCSIWVSINGIDNLALIKSIEKKVEPTEDGTGGSIRYPADGSVIYMRYLPIKNTYT